MIHNHMTGENIPVNMTKEKETAYSEIPETLLNRNKKELCSKCKYRGKLSSGTSTGVSARICNYILVEGKRRGCSPIGCTRFEVGKRIQLKGSKEEDEWTEHG